MRTQASVGVGQQCDFQRHLGGGAAGPHQFFPQEGFGMRGPRPPVLVAGRYSLTHSEPASLAGKEREAGAAGGLHRGAAGGRRGAAEGWGRT